MTFFISKLIQIESWLTSEYTNQCNSSSNWEIWISNKAINARYWMRDLTNFCDEAASSCWELECNTIEIYEATCCLTYVGLRGSEGIIISYWRHLL